MSQKTEVVYVCTPDRTWQLATSLESLFSSGSSFDTVRIYCIGERPRSWRFTDPRVVVKEVEPLHDSFFMLNKTYLTKSPADRVILLDTDTVVLKPLERIWHDRQSDFIARGNSSAMGNPNWQKALERIGADLVPHFNSGVMVFQSGAHRQISPEWTEYTLAGLEKKFFSPKMAVEKGHANQAALSVAVSLVTLSYELLDTGEVAHGWEPEGRENIEKGIEGPVVYHTGGSGFHRVDPLIDKGIIKRWKDHPFENKLAINVLCESQKLQNRVMLLLRRVYGKWVMGQQIPTTLFEDIKTACYPWLPKSLLRRN